MGGRRGKVKGIGGIWGGGGDGEGEKPTGIF